MGEKVRLVYSTEKINGFNNFDPFEQQIASEARSVFHETVSSITKSLRKHIPERIRSMQKTEAAQKVAQEIRDLVTCIYEHKKISVADINLKMFKGLLIGKQEHIKLRNRLQLIRNASKGMIFTKDGMWQIREDRPFSAEVLIGIVLKNKGDMWKKYSKKDQQKPPQTKSFGQPENTEDQKSCAPVHQVVNRRLIKPIVSVPQEPVGVPINLIINIKVQLEVEVKQ